VVETLPVGGLPVGLFEPMKMAVHRAQLRAGDLFFLYTDGVTEAEDPEARQFGEDRLEGLLAKRGHGASASQWTARIEAAVRAFARGRSQFDDITCLALRR
jgi:sigma-B regulation protein RsbU (phosphoserine phosphatase)